MPLKMRVSSMRVPSGNPPNQIPLLYFIAADLQDFILIPPPRKLFNALWP